MVKVKCQEKVAGRGCCFYASYPMVRPSDGDKKKVCGMHKNQLLRHGWKVVKQ